MTFRSRLVRAVAIATLFLGTLTACSQGSSGADPTLGGVTASSPETETIDGTYTVTYTEEEYAAAGVTDQALIDENVGEFTWTLDDGKWSYTQVSPTAGRLDDTGTYELEGTELTFQWQAATITMNAEKQPDGALVFTNVKDADYQALSDVQFGLHPWVPAD